MRLKIEVVINRILYVKNVIDKRKYERTLKQLNKLLLEEGRKY